ncbi:MAG: helix-turn-helix transcriptional regulator [bacterium]
MNKTTNNLRLYRNRVGLYQREVAEALKLDCTDRLSKWEAGHAVPNIINLFRLAIIYKVSPRDLYPELWQMIESQLEENTRTKQTASDNPGNGTVKPIASVPSLVPEEL